MIKLKRTAVAISLLLTLPLSYAAEKKIDLPKNFIKSIQQAHLKKSTPAFNAVAKANRQESEHQALVQNSLGTTPSTINTTLKLTGAKVHDNKIVVDITVRSEPEKLKKELIALGATNISEFGRIISARIPVENMGQLQSNQLVAMAQLPLAVKNVGLVESQGDAAMGTDVIREISGVTGEGVRVGVISDSYACNPPPAVPGAPSTTADQDILNGDISSDIIVLAEGPCPGSDEGRAMMQLIYDVAPGVSLAFHTAFNGAADFANGILELATEADSNVIVDDIIYLNEPMFQDGIISQAATQVTQLGVPYFSSAGNNGRDSFESNFNGIEIDEGIIAHDFDPTDAVDLFQTVSLTRPENSDFAQTTLSFQWDHPNFSVSGEPGASGNLDLAFFDMNGTQILDCFNDQDPIAFPDTGGFPPICQFGQVDNIGGDAGELVNIVSFNEGITEVQLALLNTSGEQPTQIKYVPFARSGSFDLKEYETFSGTAYGHANGENVMGVGAAPFITTAAFDDILFGGECLPACAESFSSAGGVKIYFDIDGNRYSSPIDRFKPDVTGPDGTNTTFFGGDSGIDDDVFPNFFGTSASAPHVAAVAALMIDSSEPNTIRPNDGSSLRVCFRDRSRLISKQVVDTFLENYPETRLGFCLSPEEIYSTLENTALDMTKRLGESGPFEFRNGIGFDFDTGHGYVDGISAVNAVAR
ncbi:MAG: S8 family serine peptidase [Pseudomonadota bacterium]